MNYKTTLIALGLLISATAASISSAQTLIVFKNETGLDDSQVYITLQGGAAAIGLTGGGNTITDNTSYSLSQLTSNTGVFPGTVANLNLTQYEGGLIMVTAGQTIGSATPANNIVNGRFEVNIQQGNLSANNVDVSYVNSISMPIAFSVKLQTTGALATLPQQLNQVTTTPGATIFNNLNGAVPNAAFTSTANYNVYSSNNPGTPVGTMTGVASVQSPSNASVAGSYNSWLTPNNGTSATNNALIPYLTNNNISLTISSYTSSVTAPYLPGALFGFSTVTEGNSGALPQSPFNLGGANGDPTNSFLQGQSYNMTATFVTDLNPGGANANLTAQGITAGTGGVIITGSGTAGNGTGTNGNAVGTFTIYITNANLGTATGIYGNNPTYTVSWNGLYVTTQNTNSLVDRAVGDLLAGITFGWSASNVTVAARAAASGTASYLAGTEFATGGALANTPINQLTTGQYFYLLSLMAQGGGAAVAQWTGQNIDSSPYFYDTYGSAFAANTDAYTFPYSDRLQGASPDIFYTPPSTSYDTSDVYIEVDLLPGAYSLDTSNVVTAAPEPSTWAMLLGGLGALLLYQRRRSARR